MWTISLLSYRNKCTVNCSGKFILQSRNGCVKNFKNKNKNKKTNPLFSPKGSCFYYSRLRRSWNLSQSLASEFLTKCEESEIDSADHACHFETSIISRAHCVSWNICLQWAPCLHILQLTHSLACAAAAKPCMNTSTKAMYLNSVSRSAACGWH